MTPFDPAHGTQSTGAPARLLILGCGYVGGAVARAALRRGWTVTALTRNEARVAELRALGVDAITGDLTEASWHDRVAREQDHVLNCVSAGGGGLTGYWRSYVEGMRSVLAWAAPGVPATLVYTGSTGVYPQGGGEVVTEDSPVGGGSEASAPLLEAERLVREAACFRRAFVLRLAGIYGPGRHYLLDQLRAGATVFPGTGGHRLNLVHRDDIVAAIMACFDAPVTAPGDVFNLCDDTPAPKQEVVAWLCAHLGRGMPVFAQDGGSLPSGQPVVRGRSGPVPDRILSNARIKAALGWRPQFPDYRSGYAQILAGQAG